MKLIRSFLLITIIFFSCTREKDDCNSPPLILKSSIKGHWVSEDYPDEYRFGGEYYDFSFKTDSFYLKRLRWTDVIYSQECTKFEWFNYIGGTYSLNENKMSLMGEFLDSNFVFPADSGACNSHEWGSYFIKANITLCNEKIEVDPIEGNSYYTIPIKLKRG